MVRIDLPESPCYGKAYKSVRASIRYTAGIGRARMELYFFGKFHTHAGKESAFEEVAREVLPPSRAKVGCVSIHVFRSTQDPKLFYIHSMPICRTPLDFSNAYSRCSIMQWTRRGPSRLREARG